MSSPITEAVHMHTSTVDEAVSITDLIHTDSGPDPDGAPDRYRVDQHTFMRNARRRRVFELVVVLAGLPVWGSVVAMCALVLLMTNGRPILYRSSRRVYRREQATILKFRTMVRDAAEIFNRATIPVESQRFLNIPLDSPAYTRVGRMIERCSLTELPQLAQVISGRMALVGNRPLPEDVIAALKESYPGVEARFWARSGVIGPAQLVGREELTDEQRLELEIAFACACLRSGALSLSLLIFVEGILISARLRPARRFEEVLEILSHSR